MNANSGTNNRPFCQEIDLPFGDGLFCLPTLAKLAQLTRLATVPEQVTHSGAPPVNTPQQWAFPSVNETAVAKTAQQRAIILTGRKQLMKDLHSDYDPFLKTSFGHSPQKLRYAVQEMNDRLGTGRLFDADIADLRLLTKYIESDYQRVTLPDAFAGEREDARQAASMALSRLGDCLTARKTELISADPGARETGTDLVDPPLLILAKTWLQALGIMVRKHPTGDNVKKNYENLRMLMTQFLTCAQFQRMSDYASSNCFIALCNLINSVPPHSRDDQFLYTKQKQLKSVIKQTIRASLEFAATGSDVYALDHLRRAMDAYTAIGVRVIKYSPMHDPGSLLKPLNRQLTHWLKTYKDLGEKSPLREEIRVVLAKYVADTGQNPTELSRHSFHGLFKPLNHRTLVPHKTPLSTGGELQSQLALSPCERDEIGRELEKTVAKFVALFGFVE